MIPYVLDQNNDEDVKKFSEEIILKEEKIDLLVNSAYQGLVAMTPHFGKPFWERPISVYDGHDLKEEDGLVYIDGSEATNYTFEQDYYWMMGDNRHRSADSRMWGFVPYDHIVGRASFTWFSRQTKEQHGESKIRWDRVFTNVK